MAENKDTVERLNALEQSVRRWRSLTGGLAVVVVATSLYLHYANHWTLDHVTVKTLSIVDGQGRELGTWGTVNGCPTFVVISPTGQRQLIMRADDRNTGIIVQRDERVAAAFGTANGSGYLMIDKGPATQQAPARPNP